MRTEPALGQHKTDSLRGKTRKLGKQRYVEVDFNYQALQSRGLTPFDVISAISAQNLTLPSGTIKIGESEYQVGLHPSPHFDRGVECYPRQDHRQYHHLCERCCKRPGWEHSSD
jgi:hypothetical protein